MREVKFKFHFNNHAPVVLTLNQLINGDAMANLIQKGSGQITAKREFTGCRDKWIKNELYDGDLIKHDSRNGGKPHPIKWSTSKGGWVGDYGIEYLIAPELLEIEKVGNVHEHPHLTKGE
jgi:hypothetical protein